MAITGERAAPLEPWRAPQGLGVGLRAWARSLRERFSDYRAVRMAPEEWDRHYRAGEWDWMSDVTELGRYSVVSGYVRRRAEGAAVLDIGCGEGVLLDHLDGHVGRYVGLDVSEEAVTRARERRPGWHYLAGDAATVDLDHPALAEGGFDVVVLNECLYYFDDPVAVVQRYRPLLAPDGVLVVSMFDHAHPAKAWATLRPHVRLLDEVLVTHETGKRWLVRMVQLPTPPPATLRPDPDGA